MPLSLSYINVPISFVTTVETGHNKQFLQMLYVHVVISGLSCNYSKPPSPPPPHFACEFFFIPHKDHLHNFFKMFQMTE